VSTSWTCCNCFPTPLTSCCVSPNICSSSCMSLGCDI
jgi:hypothetical protein